MKTTNFWVVTPCNSDKARHSGGTYYLHLQGRRVTKKPAQIVGKFSSASTGFLLDLFSDHEDGGYIFLRIFLALSEL
jgi:hypothetical protein